MDKTIVKNEIEKYLMNPTRTQPFSKIVDRSIIEEFTPKALGSFVVDNDSIHQADNDEKLFDFAATGDISFEDKTSKVIATTGVRFRGVACIADFDGRSYVDAVVITSLPSASEILSAVITSEDK